MPRLAALSDAPPWLRWVGLLLIVLLVAGGAWNLLRPVPAAAATSSIPVQSAVTGTPPTLPWPSVGSAAVGVSKLGLIATSGDVPPAPAASVAKVMTALVVLTDRPLAKGETGPEIIITEQDVASYKTDMAEGQSVVPVITGEHLSEFDALQGLLIPSGNNIAETIARWDAGSVPAFVTKMNQQAVALHLKQTTFADPAGVSTQTVSTPPDLVALGMAAMQHEAFAQIVNEAQTDLPVAGTVYNVNAALGQNGIIGIKTGSGLDSGANFLFAASLSVDGQHLTLFGGVMGLPTLDAAFTEAKALIATMRDAVRVRQVVTRNGVVGAYKTAWGSSSNLVATVDVLLVEWPGMNLQQQIEAKSLTIDGPVPAGAAAGELHVVLGDQQIDVPLVTTAPLDPPGFIWRLLRINL